MNIDAIRKRFENLKLEEEHYECEKCQDRGYTFEVREGYEVAVPCGCLAKKQALEKLERSGLSEAFKKRTFDTYKIENRTQMQAKRKAMDFCENWKVKRNSLLLTGQPGSGKTHLGIAAMLNLIDSNVGCKYVEYGQMLINLKQSCMDQVNYIRELDKYLNPTVLFIDDFLKGKTNDADLKYIYQIVNSRYLQGKAVIISTEMTIDEIISWDEAIGSRLAEMANGNIINFARGKGNNYRLRGIV